ncbi:hypothetical protein KKI24_27850, partial [bacterium]|nr:hypothetical protein [bacterium]
VSLAVKEYVEETRPKLARKKNVPALFLDPRGDRLTRQGFWQKLKEYAKSAPSPLQDKLVSALSRLSNQEQSAISQSLSKIVELMEAEEIDAGPVLEAGQIISE